MGSAMWRKLKIRYIFPRNISWLRKIFSFQSHFMKYLCDKIFSISSKSWWDDVKTSENFHLLDIDFSIFLWENSTAASAGKYKTLQGGLSVELRSEERKLREFFFEGWKNFFLSFHFNFHRIFFSKEERKLFLETFF